MKMSIEKCIYCCEIIPKGKLICPICEWKLTKVGTILQSKNVTKEEIDAAYRFLEKKVDNNEQELSE